jgi:hypothetical protein
MWSKLNNNLLNVEAVFLYKVGVDGFLGVWNKLRQSRLFADPMNFEFSRTVKCTNPNALICFSFKISLFMLILTIGTFD